MNDPERIAFLARPLIAAISTVGTNGPPHSVPAWYEYRDGDFFVWTDSSRRWVKNLARENRISLVVAEQAPPYAAVIVHGTAQVSIDGPGTDDAIRRIVARYIPAEQAESYAKQWSALRTIVRITPSLVRSWAQGY